MRWDNIKLIFWREVRDQLRDRRTLFTVAVLPLLLYPLLGMSFLQMAQFLREHPTKIRVVGTSALPDDPPLLDGDHFAEAVCPDSERRLMELMLVPETDDTIDVGRLTRRARFDIHAGRYDALVWVPAKFGEQLTQVRDQLRKSSSGPPQDSQTSEPTIEVPQPLIFSNTANDRSRIAARRAETVLVRWRDAMVRANLEANHIPIAATQPFEPVDTDVAEEVSKRAAVWSKVLPFIVLIWALTGAFYPAIDLCAGEKERGTLETLLCSPALRNEIVWGKLLTIMAFSICTSLLNLACITTAGSFFVRKLEQTQGMAEILRVGTPPVLALGWLVLALAPLAALFSALSLAIASFARSSREGQYYLMPLLLVCLPLMMLPMLPTAELDLGTSFVPITGVMLLMRALIEGQYGEALIFFPPVALVTTACCWLAVRWAVDQFNNESVLFRESERWDLRLVARNMFRNRGRTPTLQQALLCGVLLLMARFFASFIFSGVADRWTQFASTTLITQVGMIAIPAVALTLLLTRSMTDTLLLKPTTFSAAAGSVLLAVALHPVGIALAGVIRQVYPIGPELQRELGRLGEMISEAPNVWSILALLAVIPACCEELAFRGFILSGLRHSGRPWLAIVVSSFLFGAVHSVLQQSIATFILGLAIGFVAVRTGSLINAILFHVTYNSLALLLGLEVRQHMDTSPALAKILVETPFGLEYRSLVVLTSGLVATLLLLWFHRLPAPKSDEELLRQALDEAPLPPSVK